MNNIEVGARIRFLRKKKGLSQEDLAKILNLKNNSIISQYESGKVSASQKILELIAEEFSISYYWLLTGEEIKNAKEILMEVSSKMSKQAAIKNLVPYLHKLKMRIFPIVSKISAGNMKEYFEDLDPEKTVVIPYKHDNCVALQVDGDSMANKIDNGDLVLVDLYKNVKDGDVVAVRLKSGEQLIKRFKRVNGTIILYSDNNKYTPVAVKETEIETMKKVVKIIKDV